MPDRRKPLDAAAGATHLTGPNFLKDLVTSPSLDTLQQLIDSLTFPKDAGGSPNRDVSVGSAPLPTNYMNELLSGKGFGNKLQEMKDTSNRVMGGMKGWPKGGLSTRDELDAFVAANPAPTASKVPYTGVMPSDARLDELIKKFSGR